MNNLDVLRAVAVLLVLADHVLEAIGRKYGYDFHPYDYSLGRTGVLLFFVHTSFVLHQSMERLKLTGGELVRSFLIRRAFRLYPLAILTVLLVVALDVPTMPWDAQHTPPSAGALASNLLLTMNLTYTEPVLGPLWSLPVEAQMYVALPFVFLFAGKRPWVMVGLIAVAWVVAEIQPHVSRRLDVLSFAPCFLAGALAYAMPRREVIPAWLWLPSLLVLVGLFAAFKHVLPYEAQWVACLLVGIAVPMFKDLPKITLAHLIAKYSYGIYLFHCIGLWAGLYVLDAPDAVQWAAFALITATASVTAYHVLEKPMIDLGASLARRSLTFRLPRESSAGHPSRDSRRRAGGSV